MDNIIYKIRLNTISLNFELRINDIKVASENGGEAFSSQIPINEWLINGTNLIQLKVDTSKLELNSGSFIRLIFGMSQNESDSFNEIHNVEHEKLHINPVTNVLYSFPLKDHPITLPLKELPFMNIADNAVVRKVFNFSRHLYLLFENKEKQKILDLCRFSLDEYDKLYYNPTNTSYQKFEKVLTNVFNTQEMLNYLEQELTVKIYAGGKILALEYEEENLPAILAAPPDYSLTRMFFFFFALDKEGEPFIYR